MEQKKVGVIGTGRMGNAFSLNLLKAGHKVFVYDVDPKAAENLVAQGAILASPPEIAFEAEFVITSLPKNEIVEETILGAGGLLPKLHRGSIVIDMSTTLPRTTKAIAGELAGKGIDFLDAPVSGHVVGAKNATLTILVGGKREAFLRGGRSPSLRSWGRIFSMPARTGRGKP